jgi:hypothetical protein
MVTPAQKFAQPALLPSFSRDGERILMLVRMALAETPGYQFYEGDHYVALRDGTGWELAPTSPRDPAITAGGRRWGGAMVFSVALDRWVMVGATQSQYSVGIARLLTGGLDGSFEPLSPLLVPIEDSPVDLPQSVLVLELSGTSFDARAAVVRVKNGSTGYLADDPRGSSNEPGGDRNSYVAFLDEPGEPVLELLARDKEGEVFGGRCGAHLGGPGTTFDQDIEPHFVQGALSPDGGRVYFSARPNQLWDEEDLEGPPCDIGNGLRVLKRTITPDGPVIEEIAPGGGGKAAPGDDLFQAASADGTRVYFLTPRKLTAADTDANSGPCSGNIGASKGCDLYLYDENRAPGDRIVLASDGPEEASVLNSTSAVSGDGSRAYFVARGVLTAGTNPEGDAAIAGQPNLYLYEAQTGELSFVAALSGDDASEMWDVFKGQGFGDAYAAPTHGAGPEDGGDGHVLAFASKAPITSDDLDGGFRDVFRYDAGTDTIERISKAAAGGADNGPFDAAVNPAWFEEHAFNFNEATRWVSEDGQLIGFATKEPLLGTDTDEAVNPYFWEAGTLGAALAPLFEKGDETRPPAVAPVGGQVAFSTSAALLGLDTDVVEDIYVARPNGGFAEPEPPAPCDPLQESSCQGPPSTRPGAVPLSPTGPSGNVKPQAKCKKGVMRKGRCVRKKQGKRKAGKRSGQNREASG